MKTPPRGGKKGRRWVLAKRWITKWDIGEKHIRIIIPKGAEGKRVSLILEECE